MSQTSKPEDLEPESTEKTDETASTPEDHDEQKSEESVVSDVKKSAKSIENESGIKEPSEQKEVSTESRQEKRNSALLSQEKTYPADLSQEKPSNTAPNQKRLKFMSFENKRRSTDPTARKIKVSESVRQIVIWTMTGFFDFNPRYFIQVRGLTNIMHMILSLSDVILLGQTCQLKSHPKAPSEGFYCGAPQIFLFIVSCSTLSTSVLYLISCVLSKSTDILLFQSSFEVSYFVLYFILLLTASLTLIVSELNWGTDEEVYENDYEASQVAAIIGLINSVMYGISAVWFFMSHRLQQKENDAVQTKEES